MSANTLAAQRFPEMLQEMSDEGEYLPEQVFNVDEKELSWKRMPVWSYISKEEKLMPGYKAATATTAKSLQSCLTLWPHPWDSPVKNTGVGCHFLLQCIKVKSESEVAHSCPTHCDPMDCSLPGSSVHGIFQERVLEWGAIAFSNKTAKDRLNLLFGDSASNNLKLKPLLVYHSKNLRALKNIAKGSFPIVWKSNPKTWVRHAIFQN